MPRVIMWHAYGIDWHEMSTVCPGLEVEVAVVAFIAVATASRSTSDARPPRINHANIFVQSVVLFFLASLLQRIRRLLDSLSSQ